MIIYMRGSGRMASRWAMVVRSTGMARCTKGSLSTTHPKLRNISCMSPKWKICARSKRKITKKRKMQKKTKKKTQIQIQEKNKRN